MTASLIALTNPYRVLLRSTLEVATNESTYNQRSGLPLTLPALDDLIERFGSWYHIERRGHCIPVLEVTHPQVAPSELPLGVGSFLQIHENSSSIVHTQ